VKELNFLQSVKMSFRNIQANKMRAILTMLGIIIGVSSVIVLMSIGQGSAKQITDQVGKLGSNLLTVNIMNPNENIPYTERDASEFTQIAGVKQSSPTLSGDGKVKREAQSENAPILGATRPFQSLRELTLSSGRFLADIDHEYRHKVVVLGSELAQSLFPSEDAVGKQVQINGNTFKVIGVLASKGGSMGQNIDQMAIVPLSTAQRLLKNNQVNAVYVQVQNEEQIPFVKAKIEQKLLKTFRGDESSFFVLNQKDLIDTVSSVNQTLTLLLGGIASISLLVGGIGIMNIMLVSVTERTKEIGLRKAVGAKGKDIYLQFLIEAIVLSGFGGLIGLGVGIASSLAVSSLGGMPIEWSANIMILSVTFSLIVGILFGVYPATKAAKLNPIEALRYE